MVYPGTFYRLVFLGKIYTDTLNMTLSVVPTSGSSVPDIDQSVLTDMAPVISTWWSQANTTSPGIGITQNATLQGFKFNKIGTDGRYTQAETLEHTYPVQFSGVGPAGLPAQLSVAATIRGLNERQRAGKGRMYLPSNFYSATLGTDGRMSVANATAIATRFDLFLDLLDGVFIDNSLGAIAGIASKQGTGAFQVRSKISVGRVVDTVRSRRSSLDEDPQYAP
jgi:hypothetical protein